MENVAPCPGDDSTAAAPPWASATARTIASPSPEPSLVGIEAHARLEDAQLVLDGNASARVRDGDDHRPCTRACSNEDVARPARPPTRRSRSGCPPPVVTGPGRLARAGDRRPAPCELALRRGWRSWPRLGRRPPTSTSSSRREPRSASASIRSMLRHAASERSTSVRNEASSSPPILTALDDRSECSCRAAHLVHHESQLLALIRRRHVVRAAMRSSAHAAVSLSIGSGPEACAWMDGTSSSVPTFPAATSALRRSHRGSFRGT